ncbi:MAG: sigma factor-like helix-turn-helix DNA-binding protein [Atribacterota bacterium]|jgi:RNA polymerase sigma factor (sigma-70 family)|nr:sigma factor-like helix-turn-helix DNA-binding protein [Atribacterota bacterium]MDD4896455.1 sigma factor-like helix-turn-helix DNA-binding protein [Atribacterota bacterium]MDD5636869.1 sigma factor-like helix-turn-helix DNA-binding protein [Atribacterota bacterium]
MNYHDLENHLLNIVIEECLSKLAWQERKIILLYYWCGYRDAEIGNMLGKSQQIINYRRNQALKKIKQTYLKGFLPPEQS